MRLLLVLGLLALACAPAARADDTSCSTVPSDDADECCQSRVAAGVTDEWCQENYPELYGPVVGSSCGTVSPDSRKDCCQTKVDEDTEDTWCQDNYPELYNPPGSSCSSVNPDDTYQCCEGKVSSNTDDAWCESEYPELYHHASDDNVDKYPYMAYIKTAGGTKCAGSLIAPGYVLTAAQCVWLAAEDAAVDASDITLWVGGQTHAVAEVLVNTDNAKFDNFTAGDSQPAWDIAVLALEDTSDAAYVALPTTDVPALGDWVEQTAWGTPKHVVDSAQIPVWNGCATGGWPDEFCMGGSGFLQACPEDKGAPVMQSHVQVGLTSGPGCEGETDDWGYAVKLADKGILAQITVWLNHREGTDNTGLDDNVRAWLQEANTYIYSRR